ncbi:MAG: choice-of-anchor tandem repeat NxxGxxAF-containing protein [Planctomycetota bacterium]
MTVLRVNAEFQYQMIALTGDPVPSVGDSAKLYEIDHAVLGPPDRILVFGSIEGPGINALNDDVALSFHNGGQTLVARSGQSIDPDGHFVFQTFHIGANSLGEHIYLPVGGIGSRLARSDQEGLLLYQDDQLSWAISPTQRFPMTSLTRISTIRNFSISQAGAWTVTVGLSQDENGVPADQAILFNHDGQLYLVARQNHHLPARNDHRFIRFHRPLVDEQGQLVFTAAFTGPTSSRVAPTGIFRHDGQTTELVVGTGSAAPGDRIEFARVRLVSSTAERGIVFDADIRNAGKTRAIGSGLFREKHGKIEPIIMRGDPAPGFPAGVTLAGIYLRGTGPNGHVAFIARLAGPNIDERADEVLFVETQPGIFVAAAQPGQALPPSQPIAVFREDQSTLHPSSGVELTEPIAYGFALVDPLGRVVFTSNQTGPDVSDRARQGLYLADEHQRLHLIARVGDMFDVTPHGGAAEQREIKAIHPYAVCGLGTGSVVFGLDFADQTTGLFVAIIGN